MSYLMHHGIKGQKWGVRRYQNRDGTYTSEGKRRRNGTELTVHSGQKLIRISEPNDTSIKEGMYYSLASEQQDVDKYVGLYADFMKKSGKNVVMQVLESNGKMSMPTHKKSVTLMEHTLDSLHFRTDKTKQEALRKHFKETDIENASEDVYFKKASKQFDQYLKTGKVGNDLYDCLNVDFAFRSSPIMQDIANRFYHTCSDNGYDIIKDINDSKYGDMHAKIPIILANASKVKMSSIRNINDADISNARKNLDQKDVREWDNNSSFKA